MEKSKSKAAAKRKKSSSKKPSIPKRAGDLLADPVSADYARAAASKLLGGAHMSDTRRLRAIEMAEALAEHPDPPELSLDEIAGAYHYLAAGSDAQVAVVVPMHLLLSERGRSQAREQLLTGVRSLDAENITIPVVVTGGLRAIMSVMSQG